MAEKMRQPNTFKRVSAADITDYINDIAEMMVM
jgi:hypothetical protein